MKLINQRKILRLTITLHLDHAYEKSVIFLDSAKDIAIVTPMYSLLEYSEINIVCRINIKTKWIMLMNILQVINHLRIRQNVLGRTPERPPQPENFGDADRPP